MPPVDHALRRLAGRLLVAALLSTACASTPDAPPDDASPDDATPNDATRNDAAPSDVTPDDASALDVAPDLALDAPRPIDRPPVADAPSVDRAAPVDVAPPCRTRITYGGAWIRPDTHPEAFDDTDGNVSWDGVCHDDGANSYATLSNGWRPYFSGRGRCALGLDASHCAGAPTACETRFTYASTWSHPPGHPGSTDDVDGYAAWDGVCHASGAQTFAVLSNGWRPYFNGACGVSVRQRQCGARYVNPVIGDDCPDPGVMRVGEDYYMVCTSGGAAAAFPIRVSRDLVHWTPRGAVFPAGRRPSWASGDFWAPEIHRVGSHYVVYYSARRAGGQLALGAASGPSPTGPFTDLGRPLLEDRAMGLIDATEFEAPDGARYLYWKEDGNALGRPTPIHGQRLAADGLSLTGARATLLTNDRAWEGNLVEGPWLYAHGGSIYLFYSGNAYYDARYAMGVARAASPLGPFVKASGPLLTSNAAFAGPGHGSVLDTPSGDTVLVYHAWRAGFFAASGSGRQVLLDRVAWSGGWPTLTGAPTSAAQRVP